VKTSKRAAPVSADLQEIINELIAVETDGERVVEPLDDEQLNWSPAQGAWSIAQCIDHLNATNARYFQALDRGRASSRPGSRAHPPDCLVMVRPHLCRDARTARPPEGADAQNDPAGDSPAEGGGLARVRAAAHTPAPVRGELG